MARPGRWETRGVRRPEKSKDPPGQNRAGWGTLVKVLQERENAGRATRRCTMKRP